MLVGLIAAALGIRRTEAGRLQALSNVCRFAVRTDSAGGLLVDYHTVQSAKRKKNFAPATRKQMLEEGDRTTIITRREYRLEVHYTVALSLTGGDVQLADIAAALKEANIFALSRPPCLSPGIAADAPLPDGEYPGRGVLHL